MSGIFYRIFYVGPMRHVTIPVVFMTYAVSMFTRLFIESIEDRIGRLLFDQRIYEKYQQQIFDLRQQRSCELEAHLRYLQSCEQ